MRTMNPGKQRRHLYNAPLHKRRKWIAAHLEENLLLKYDKRSIPVIKGDTVRVMRGSFRGHEDKIARVNVKKRSLEIEGITMAKANGNKIAKPIHPSNVMITKLNLTDKWRRKTIERGLSEDVRKEIELEAKDQLKELEEEKKRREEEEKALEKMAEAEEDDIEEKPTEKPEKKDNEPTKKPEPKKEEKPAKKPVQKPKQAKIAESKAKKPATKKQTKTTSPKPKKKQVKKEDNK